MQRGKWFVVVALLLAVATVYASTGRVPIQNYPVRGGSNDPVINVPVAPDHGPDRDVLDLIGNDYVAGYTYYDYQHNGTSGKMIYTDANGFVHVVWMRGLTAIPEGARHIYYNFWDPGTSEFYFRVGGQPSGSLVNSSNRGGYTCLAGLPDGWVFPAFHEITGEDQNAHCAASIDFLPGLGAFTTTQPRPWIYEGGHTVEIIWPKIAIGIDSTIHMVSCENPWQGEAGDPQRIYYSRGRPTWDNEGAGVQIVWEVLDNNTAFRELDTVMVIAPLVVTSKVSDRVAILWSKSRDDLTEIEPGPSQWNNDLYYIVSEDGGINWTPEVNITQFAYPDWDCASGDTAVCERDTFRFFTDVTALFDGSDVLHACFTTRCYYEMQGFSYYARSHIWHWDEIVQEFSNVADGWIDFDSSEWIDPGAWQLYIHRPNLSMDWETGYLYCSYQRYEPDQTSEAGYPQGDAYITFSRNCGRSWAEGINVTDTDGGINAPPDSSKSERDITIPEKVTYVGGVGYIDMFYIFDRDAGGIPQTEGTATNNPAKFQRIPIDELPWTLHNPYFPAMHVDSTGFPGSNSPLDPEAIAVCPHDAVDGFSHSLRPESFRLYQNYPNPFNPATNIQFDLVRGARVTLKVYNITGQTVATLYAGQMLSAGVQTISFNASDLASGVYVYRIEVDGVVASKKMVLMK
ncbi:T9SS type A sorting domain-containing protein [bacterium]|nr:T9SS type A sorting domain-containing protein [bacterium]